MWTGTACRPGSRTSSARARFSKTATERHSDGAEDPDHDGLGNAGEFVHGTSPFDAYSGNAILDGLEFPDPVPANVATNLADVTRFLYSGPGAPQIGVPANTIDAVRVSVLRGKVVDPGGAALAGVEVSILGHGELGRTFTRADGMFELAVNGGGMLTVTYATAGRIAVQRQVDAPFQDWVVLPDVVLVPYDSNVTVVDLSLRHRFSRRVAAR